MRAIETRLDGGGTVLIEVGDDLVILNARRSGGTAAGAIEPQVLVSKLEEVASTITATCKTLFRNVIAGFDESRPDELELEFGVTLGGEVGIPLVTKGSAEADFKVKATWKFSGKATDKPSGD